MNVSRNGKWRNLHIFQDIGLILLKFGAGGYFWILNPKSTIKFLYDVILTSKWREGKMPIYHSQKIHITSLWRHLWSNFFENVNLSSSYDGLSPYQIRFNLEQGKQSYGGGRDPPGWECIKSPRWDRVKQCSHVQIFLLFVEQNLMDSSYISKITNLDLF